MSSDEHNSNHGGTNTWHRRLVQGIVLTAVGGSLTLSAQPAAALPPVVRTSSVSVSDSNPVKSAAATCPAGYKLVGTGGEVVNGGRQVILDDIEPNAFLTQVLVRAREDADGFLGNWAVRAHAICTNYNITVVRVAATSASDETNAKTATANCPAGRTLSGTGATINSGFGQVGFDDILPLANKTSVTVWAVELGGNPVWSVTAYAICSDFNSVQLQRVFSTNSNDIPTKSATVTCPADWALLGTGAELIGSGGTAIIDDITPNGSAFTAPNAVTVWAIEIDDGPAWTVRAWAICVAPPEP